MEWRYQQKCVAIAFTGLWQPSLKYAQDSGCTLSDVRMQQEPKHVCSAQHSHSIETEAKSPNGGRLGHLAILPYAGNGGEVSCRQQHKACL